jgi:hypothetical protein
MLAALPHGLELLRRVEVAVRERRGLEQLAIAVAVPVRRLDLARRVEGEPPLRARVQLDAVGRPAGDHHVVVPAERQPTEDRVEVARALHHEQDLVPLAVAVEAVGFVRGLAHAHLDVGVEHQHAAAEHRVAAGLHRSHVGEAMDVRVGRPLLERDRLEGPALRHPARRLQVVEDRLVAREALVAHHLLDEQRAVLAELDVALGGDVAESVVAH